MCSYFWVHKTLAGLMQGTRPPPLSPVQCSVQVPSEWSMPVVSSFDITSASASYFRMAWSLSGQLPEFPSKVYEAQESSYLWCLKQSSIAQSSLPPHSTQGASPASSKFCSIILVLPSTYLLVPSWHLTGYENWASHLSSLILSFLICRIVVVRSTPFLNTFQKHLV